MGDGRQKATVFSFFYLRTTGKFCEGVKKTKQTKNTKKILKDLFF